MSMKSALHEHIEALSEDEAAHLLASLKGVGRDSAAEDLLRRFERARDGFWPDEFDSHDDYVTAVRRGARDLTMLLQPAELELAVHTWGIPVGEVTEREALLQFVEAQPAEIVIRFVDYLNNRLDPDWPSASEQQQIADS
jgi:hypothetical protein